MKAFNHKWISTAMLFLVMLLAVAGCQPVSKEQPTATPTLPPPTATELVTPATSTTYTPFPSITHIYAFGDEHSDNGNWLRNAREKVAQGKFDAEI